VTVKSVGTPETVGTATELQVGDASGVVTLSLRGEIAKVIDGLAAGSLLKIRNGRIVMVKGYMRLVVDKWGKVEVPTDETEDFEPNTSTNVSATEYEQVVG